MCCNDTYPVSKCQWYINYNVYRNSWYHILSQLYVKTPLYFAFISHRVCILSIKLSGTRYNIILLGWGMQNIFTITLFLIMLLVLIIIGAKYKTMRHSTWFLLLLFLEFILFIGITKTYLQLSSVSKVMEELIEKYYLYVIGVFFLLLCMYQYFAKRREKHRSGKAL